MDEMTRLSCISDKCNKILPWALLSGLLLLGLGMYQIFSHNGSDPYTRILYLHGPATLMAVIVYAMMSLTALIGTAANYRPAYIFMDAAALPGAVFSFLGLLTSALWSFKTQNDAWTWDHCSTFGLSLFLLYCSTLAVRRIFRENNSQDKASGLIVICGGLFVPLIHFATTWRLEARPSFPELSLWPNITMTAAFALLMAAMVLLRMQDDLEKICPETIEPIHVSKDFTS